MARGDPGGAIVVIRVLLDTNVILDVLLRRLPWYVEARRLWDAVDAGRVTAYITATTLTDIYYLARRQSGHELALVAVRLCVVSFEVLPITRTELVHAIDMRGADFEDNVQIAAAVNARLDAIVTRDLAGFGGSPVEVLHPRQLLDRVS